MRLKWNTVSSSTAVMWDDAESALCCLAAHSSGHCVQRNQFCLIQLELFLFWLWALFMGRLEGSTLSIWNLAFTPSLAPFLPPLLLYSLLLHSCFLSLPPLSLLSSSAVSPTLHWWPAGESSAHSFHLLTFSSLPLLPLLCTSPLFTLHFSVPNVSIFLIWFLTLLPWSPRMPSPLLSPPICCFFIFVRARPWAYSNLPVPH